jgi:hypothetical protein
MSQRVRKIIFLFLVIASGIGLFYGGAQQIYKIQNGIRIEATVTDCRRLRRSDVCDGNWFTDHRFYSGQIENADRDDLGKKIEIMVFNGNAIKPGYRIPVVLIVLGLLFEVFGFIFWKKEMNT